MEDLTGMGKMAEAISKPLEKLIEVIAAGTGTMYRPVAIRNEGKAEAARRLALANADAQAEQTRKDIALAGTLGRLQTLVGGDPDLLRRAKARLAMQEVQGQLNIEAIADQASKELPDSVADEPVSAEWAQRFMKLASDVSSADMQTIWAKLLANEVATPGAFSVRTVEVLHALTTDEARAFQKFVGRCFTHPVMGSLAIPHGQPESVTLRQLTTLRDCGLLMHDATLGWQATLDPESPLLFQIGGKVYVAHYPRRRDMALGSYPLTKAGMELMQVADRTPDPEYLKGFLNHFQANNFSLYEPQGRELEAAVAHIKQFAQERGWPSIS